MFVPKQALFGLLLAAVVPDVAQAWNNTLGPPVFVAPGTFPTSVFKQYYNNPTATSVQVQPMVSDPVRGEYIYPENLTDPNTIPRLNYDPHLLPLTVGPAQVYASALQQVNSLAKNTFFANSTCAKCIASLEVAKSVSLAAPSYGPALLMNMCSLFHWSSTCNVTWSRNGYGAIFTQVLQNADIGGFDGAAICQNFFGFCPRQPVPTLNLTTWFPKPKPNPLPPPKKQSGKNLRVLHLSDYHLDPRYATGSEGNCSATTCCRANIINPAFPNMPSIPAPRFGGMMCDTPYSLALAGLEAIPVLSGVDKTGFDYTIFTGDLVSHDPDNQMSMDYVMYAETALYELFKKYLGGPIYTVLGNHDTFNQAQDSPYSLGGQLATQFSWNYNHVSSLWEYEGWIKNKTAEQVMTHYAAYSVKRHDGLRIITLNTDFWYVSNYFDYMNMTTPDVSGMMRFLTYELQAAEDEVWIMGHVPPGWDGLNAVPIVSDLFYQIVDRYSPHVIANTFFGHTHEDQHSIFYQNNGTVQTAETAVAISWTGPSFTTHSNLNPGFRVYEVDSATFDIIDAHTFYSNASEYPALDHQTAVGPTFLYEYSTRDSYGQNITWGASDPLNATWWHLVTEQMTYNASLVSLFTMHQGRLSVYTKPCTSTACVEAKICYIRSGSAPLAIQNCIPGYGAVH